MRSRRTPQSNTVYVLEGGNEDNYLHVRKGTLSDGHLTLDERDPSARSDAPYIASVFEPDDDERAMLASGANVELICLGSQPPVVMRVTAERPTGTPSSGVEGPHVWTALPPATARQVLDALEGRLDRAGSDDLDALYLRLEAALETLEQEDGTDAP